MQGNEVSEVAFMSAITAARPVMLTIIETQRRLAEQVGAVKQKSRSGPDPTGMAVVRIVAQPLVETVLRCDAIYFLLEFFAESSLF